MAYWAPERFDMDSQYDSRSDVWSFGISLIEILYGQIPYTDKYGNVPTDLLRLQHLVKHANAENLIAQCLQAYSTYERTKKFISECLKSYHNRPNYKGLAETEIYKEYNVGNDKMNRLVATFIENFYVCYNCLLIISTE